MSIIKKTVDYLKKNGIRLTLRRIYYEIDKKNNAKFSVENGKLNFYEYKEIGILTTPHCIYVAKLIENALKRINIKVSIIQSSKIIYKNIPYIVICPQMFFNLPKIYIAFQMEQTINSRWFGKKYFRKLKKAYAVYDYSLINIKFLQKYNKIENGKIYYMPIGYLDKMKNTKVKKVYDILFYGDIKNERRKRILDEIQKIYSVKIINNLFGMELLNEIRRSKIVLNIHYYENALLETTRIYETLSLNECILISEHSSDKKEDEYLENIIDFVEPGNIQQILKRIKFWLSNDIKRCEKIEKNKDWFNNNANRFNFYFYRFLLAIETINFDEFYRLIGKDVKLSSNMLCLSLPESIKRRDDFERDNAYGFKIFTGLRHYMGWIGCGLSYKFIMRLAKKQNFHYVVVCEDDVEFLPNFSQRFSCILNFINKNDREWDLFSGLIADLDRVSIERIDTYKDEEMVFIDRMVSMVFNIYSSHFYSYLDEWDSLNKNVDVNAIDRFLARKNMCIFTTAPFLVGHKNVLYSTLWGAQNKVYDSLIENSNKKLADLINEYKKNIEKEDCDVKYN